MMATLGARFNRSELVREARVEITLWDTPPRSMSWSLGVALVRCGVWLMGFAGTDVFKGRCGWWLSRPEDDGS